MKHHFIALIILVAAASSSLQAGNDSSKEPIVGRWRWGKNITIISGNGKAFMYAPGWSGMHGQWKLESAGNTERKYVINWEGGLWIDKVFISGDGKHLHGTNQKHHKVSATRAVEMK